MSIKYQQYDAKTLLPLNNETDIRRLELERFMHEVAGRTVLDIGCSNGFASILAAKGGATSVTAIDVDQDSLTKIDGVIDTHSLPITTKKIGFIDFEPLELRSEVVFCFEVIHWLNHQGIASSEIVKKLNQVTTNLLFVETPWSFSDTSVSKYRGTNMDSYSLKDLVECFLKENFKVEVLYFAKYFPAPNERVMLRMEVM